MNKETSYCCLGYVSNNAILLRTGHLLQGGGEGGGVLQNGKIASPRKTGLKMPPPLLLKDGNFLRPPPLQYG